jgi:hypothetical protein
MVRHPSNVVDVHGAAVRGLAIPKDLSFAAAPPLVLNDAGDYDPKDRQREIEHVPGDDPRCASSIRQ